MSKDIRIRKGVDIKLPGQAEKVYAQVPASETYFLKPTDFHGLNPKLLVKVGDEVVAGSPIFFDKYNENIRCCSPVSGEVVEIQRGEKRKILGVKILADKELKYQEFSPNPQGSREEIIEKLCEAGLWPMMKKRPFNVIADPSEKPKAIFISAFDSAPLAADNDFIVHGLEAEFQSGLDIVAKLTEGKVHLNVDAKTNPSPVFSGAKGVQINKINGPHPAGNVGVQIHHIDPINKGEVVWVLTPQDVLSIGRFFKTGKYDASKIVALAGSLVEKPRYYRVISGCQVNHMLQDNLKEGDHRVISGNVLTGDKISKDGYLGFYHNLVTVIPEGNEYDFMGWIAPGFGKFSLSRTFFSWLSPSKAYDMNANLHGEERAYVMSGQYEDVFPFDIYPVHLIKAIMMEDVEALEELGIYEVAEEDFALCEFACTSKVNVQEIVREGLDLVKKECS